MKLNTTLLSKFIQLQTSTMQELRKVLDDVGLEVKGIEEKKDATVFTIETLANRGDHLSALGVARELSARWMSTVTNARLAADFSTLRTSIPVSIDTPLCSRYAALELSSATAIILRPEIVSVLDGAVHPEAPMADISNYVLLELGQPTHAFDKEKIEGEIYITALKESEKIVALDNKEYTVPAGSVVIRDRKKTIAVAGVIGCLNSCVTKESKRFIVESAAFDPVSVRNTARAMGISTDASYTFERGSDREMILPALRRFVALAQAGGGSDDTVLVHALTYVAGVATEHRLVPLKVSTVRAQLNLPRLPELEIQARLKALGYGVGVTAEKLTYRISVPSWRLWDVEKEADLIEDIARSMSLSQIKIELPPLDYYPPAPTVMEDIVYKLEPVLHGLGFNELMTKSLYSTEEVALVEKYDPALRGIHVATKNALEKNCSNLKATNFISLARVFELNLRRGVEAFKVYETARLFRERFERAGHPYEREYDVLTFAVGGRLQDNQWKKPDSIEDAFYFAKGLWESSFDALGLTVSLKKSENKLLHPGRQAALCVGKTVIGVFGQLHPGLKDDLNVSQALIVGELDMFLLSQVVEKAEEKKPLISDFPSISRDLTLKIPLSVWSQDAITVIQKNGGENLDETAIVDEFRKPDEQFRRVSYRMLFQNPSRTLTSVEVESSVTNIIEQLEQSGFSLAV